MFNHSLNSANLDSNYYAFSDDYLIMSMDGSISIIDWTYISRGDLNIDLTAVVNEFFSVQAQTIIKISHITNRNY
jgi:hypothetical protein